MSKKDNALPESVAPSAGPDTAPVAERAPETIDLRWTPAPGNMTSTRIIDAYTWTPGAVVPVAAPWWHANEVALRTSPRETFELVAGVAAQQ